MAYRILTRDEHFSSKGPKRILALDGGGLRGILSLGILKHLEATLRARHGGDRGFRLCHYFDLIAGTSTGAPSTVMRTSTTREFSLLLRGCDSRPAAVM